MLCSVIHPCYASINGNLMSLVSRECILWKIQSMLMRRLSGILTLDITMLRIPFFKEASAAS
jgi:hypothetical protein